MTPKAKIWEMFIISRIFRALKKEYDRLFSNWRIIKLRCLYPGLNIDFKSTIEKNCRIVCVKGGRMTIHRSHVSYGSQIISDQSADVRISNTFIGRNCVIAAKENITINSNCLLAEMVVIRDQDHSLQISNGHERLGFSIAPVHINANVWLAAKVSVLKGVRIGQNSVIGASSLVNKDIPANEIWAGVPAKFIKSSQTL